MRPGAWGGAGLALALGVAAPAWAMGPPGLNGEPGVPCGAPTPPLGVALLWHQHQPRYPKLPGRQVFRQPWVRLHAAKDYVDMAERVAAVPGMKATVNLTPILLEQLLELEAGATDRHAELSGLALAEAAPAVQAEALRELGQASGPMLARWPRLAALRALPPAALSPQDWVDLQALANLAWTDPWHVRRAPGLQALLAKGQGYTRAEVDWLLALHRRLVAEVIPVHRRLQEAGVLELSTTPYHHPILPMLLDSEAMAEALPEAPRPRPPLRAPADARWQVQEAVKLHRRLFGQPPLGMWPAEGSVSQATLPLFQEAGLRWVASDEGVLAASLGQPLRGPGDRLLRPDLLDASHRVGEGPELFFRDRALSDFIGFEAMKQPGARAASALLDALVARARAPRAEGGVLSLILDGENAWEHYEGDGEAFLSALYAGLVAHPELHPVRPSEWVEAGRAKALPRLAAGSWIQASFATWAGEPDENAAWEALGQARAALLAEQARRPTGDPGLAEAWQALLSAEGSDWFWWYGQDQDSGQDARFDEAYRGLLAQVHEALGQAPPPALALPRFGLPAAGVGPAAGGAMAPGQAGAGGARPQATPAPRSCDRPPLRVLPVVPPDARPRGPVRPSLDGHFQRGEWQGAGAHFAEPGAVGPIEAVYFGTNPQGFVLSVQFQGPPKPGSLRLWVPGRPHEHRNDAGLSPTSELSWRPGQRPRWASGAPLASAAWGPRHLELSLPWSNLGARPGQQLRWTVMAGARQAFPPRGCLSVEVPDFSDPL